MATELKPCPFCGGVAELWGDDYFWVECRSCGADTKGSDDVQEVIERWNRRPEDES